MNREKVITFRADRETYFRIEVLRLKDSGLDLSDMMKIAEAKTNGVFG